MQHMRLAQCVMENIAEKIADFTSFSFHAVKNLTTAEGGALVWRDIDGVDNDTLYEKVYAVITTWAV